jgi:Chain length determinant protein
MSDQPLDLRRTMHLLWRRKFLVATAAALGLLGGAGYAARNPPLLTSTALVVLPPTVHDPATQAVIAGSDPVLAGAVRKLGPGTSLDALSRHIQIQRPTTTIISIKAQGSTAAQAERAANAVARSYIAFARSSNSPTGKAQPQLLQTASTANGTPPPIHLALTGGFGFLVGALLGCVGALAISRRDQRLRRRDDIADATGVPVLASLDVAHPSDPAGWTRLLEEYQPGAADGWRLRKALHYLELAEVIPANGNAGSSLTVLSLSSDAKALALGPQLALFAASIGIPTALLIGPQQDANATAALRAACAAGTSSPRRARKPQLIVADHDTRVAPGVAALVVAVAVVDGQAPRPAGLIRTHATVLGVSAGAVTAGQLARVAASAAAGGRDLSGILIADPDPGDHTTGRVPQLTRPARGRMPTRLTGAPVKVE